MDRPRVEKLYASSHRPGCSMRDSIGHSPTSCTFLVPLALWLTIGMQSYLYIHIYLCTHLHIYIVIYIALLVMNKRLTPRPYVDGEAHHWDLDWWAWREPGDERL